MENLETELKNFRNALAQERNIPPYCIFNNKTAQELAEKLPLTPQELTKIKGFGEKRIKDFGPAITQFISSWLKQNNTGKTQILKNTVKKETPADVPAGNRDNKFIEETLLECIKKFNGEFCKAGIKKIVKGSKTLAKGYGRQKYYLKAVCSHFFGCLKKYNSNEIEDALKRLLAENKILQTMGKYPVLKIAGEDYCFINFLNFKPKEKIPLKTVNIANIAKDKNYHETLLKNLGYENFLPDQWSVIEKLLNGKKVLLVEKTGFGKSLCYQYSADLFYKQAKGLTLVFSPLVCLIREEINSLKDKGIKAGYVVSAQTYGQNLAVLEQAVRGELALLYIASECLQSDMWLDYVSKMKLALVVIDGAHCISKRGHDFRPGYRRILNHTYSLPENSPVLALTDGATKQVSCDIVEQLGGNAEVVRGTLSRDNLRLFCIGCNNETEKLYWVLRIVKNTQGCGLIYCGRKTDTQTVASWLNFNGINACNYHAGTDKILRLKTEKEFFENKYKALVCTNALEMGIAKKDVRFIIHFQMPADLASYYREAGRAGRDGKPALAVLLYNPKDKELAEFLISKTRPEVSKYREAILKLKEQPLSKEDLAAGLCLGGKETEIILNDLFEQDIIQRQGGFYKYNLLAPALNEDYFIWYNQQKLKELRQVEQYGETDLCRMKYLCNYLEDFSAQDCGICDNCKQYKFVPDNFGQVKAKADDFYLEYSIIDFIKVRNKRVEIRSLCYEDSSLGQSILKLKQDKMNFSQNLGDKCAGIIKKYFASCDLILYVPNSLPGKFTANFAHKVAEICGIKISDGIVKIKRTQPQKSFVSKKSKIENVRRAFSYRGTQPLSGKNILLLDDITDSKATIEFLSGHLFTQGAASVNAFTLIKTAR